MNTPEAIQFLKNKGINVAKVDKTNFAVCDAGGEPWVNSCGKTSWTAEEYNNRKNLWTGREIVKLARSFMENKVSSIIKPLSNKKDRSSTRDAINSGQFDKIPLNKRTKEEDPWGWD